VKQADVGGYIHKGLQESVRTSTVGVSPDLLSPPPLTSSTMKTPENTEEESDDPVLEDERDV
jgi:hypothetical protein